MSFFVAILRFLLSSKSIQNGISTMRDLLTRTVVLLVATMMIGNSSAMNITTEDNPLLAKWEGPCGGVPPFDRVQIPLFKPALEAGMTENLAEIEKIANNPAPPDFETRSSPWNVPGRHSTASERCTASGDLQWLA